MNGRVNETCARIIKIREAGSLKREVTEGARAAAFGKPVVEDTCATIHFADEDAGGFAPRTQPATTSPVPSPTCASPPRYTPFGAIALWSAYQCGTVIKTPVFCFYRMTLSRRYQAGLQGGYDGAPCFYIVNIDTFTYV
jgi:hypothetical protein